MLLLFHLLLLLPFGALLVVNCGKEKKKKEESKEPVKSLAASNQKTKETTAASNEKEAEKQADRKAKEKETLADRKKKEEKEKQEKIDRDEKHKKNFGIENEETVSIWEDCKDFTGTCNCFEQFKPPCDLAYRLRIGYNRIREHCHKLAHIHFYTNVKYWTLYEEEIGMKLYLPYFSEIKKTFQEHHAEYYPLSKKETNEILDVFKQIEKDFELVIAAKKQHENDDKEIYGYYQLREEIVIYDDESWMKPSWFEEYDKETKQYEIFKAYHRKIKVKAAWKDRNDFDGVIKTCRKKETNGRGECDFMKRANFYIGQWRIHAHRDPPFSMKGCVYDEGNEYSPRPDDILKYETEICDTYMRKVDEAKEEHRGHLKEPKEMDEWFQLHKDKTKELKERYAKGSITWCEEWKNLVGYKEQFLEIPLGEKEKE